MLFAYLEELLKKGQWTSVKMLGKLTDEQIKQILDLWNDTYVFRGKMYTTEIPFERFLRNEGTKAVLIVDKDNIDDIDAFIIYKETQYGNKISFLGSKETVKNFLIKKLISLLKQDYWFIEASANIEDLLKRRKDIDVIQDEEALKDVISNNIEMLKDGYYKRDRSDGGFRLTKRLYGKIKY